jgi:hypothetical protein
MPKARDSKALFFAGVASAFLIGSAAAEEAKLDAELLRAAFESADTSGDGLLDEGEYAADIVTAFVAVDSNGDERLSSDELHDAGAEVALTLDADHDGSLTIIEVMRAKIVDFENADKNGDGNLTIEEAAEFQALL